MQEGAGQMVLAKGGVNAGARLPGWHRDSPGDLPGWHRDAILKGGFEIVGCTCQVAAAAYGAGPSAGSDVRLRRYSR